MNKRDRNFTRAKLQHSLAETDATIARYLAELDAADVAEDSEPSVWIAELPGDRALQVSVHPQLTTWQPFRHDLGRKPT